MSNLKHEMKNSLEKHIKDFKVTLNEVRTSPVIKFITTLPGAFNPLIASLGEITNANSVPLETVREAVLDYELKLKDGKVSGETQSRLEKSSSVFSSEKKNKKNNKTCTFCSKKGHSQSECWFYKRKFGNAGERNDTKSDKRREPDKDFNSKGSAKKKNESSGSVSFLTEVNSGTLPCPKLEHLYLSTTLGQLITLLRIRGICLGSLN